MPHITKVCLSNFRRFRILEISLNPEVNTIIGDNEAGKSSILQAIELVAGGSRSKVDTCGIDTLLNKEAVNEFLAGDRQFHNLPELVVDVYLSDLTVLELVGGYNSDKDKKAAGLRMVCRPDPDYAHEINTILAQQPDNFPYEYYITQFITFSGEAYSGYRRFLKCLSIDSSQINSEYANREYIRTVYSSIVGDPQRAALKNEYRLQKLAFKDEKLKGVNAELETLEFAIRSGAKFNLETDLTLTQDEIPIDERGKGHQCFIKTEFALNRKKAGSEIDTLLLEEPENHLSHSNMKRLISRISDSHQNQIIIATHSSLISTRLDLKNSILLNSSIVEPLVLQDLSPDTSKFFMKAPDNNILEFVLSSKVFLVEGDAEYLVLDALYTVVSGSTLEADNVHVISIGGTSFKRYMELAKILGIRTAIIRDNDRNYQRNCVENYADYVTDNICVFSDQNDARYTFEVCIYHDNAVICDKLFSGGRIKKAPLEYMLDNKAESAFRLVENHAKELNAPGYIREAIGWINA